MIREKLSEGWTEDQIKQLFVDQYGDRVLAEPPRTGLNWLVYILPPLIFLIGIFVVYRILTSMKKSSPKKATSQSTYEVVITSYSIHYTKLYDSLYWTNLRSW